MKFTETTSREEVIREKIAIRESMLAYAKESDKKRVPEHEAAIAKMKGWLEV